MFRQPEIITIGELNRKRKPKFWKFENYTSTALILQLKVKIIEKPIFKTKIVILSKMKQEENSNYFFILNIAKYSLLNN